MKKGIAALVGAAVAATAVFTACSLKTTVEDYLFSDDEEYVEFAGMTVEFKDITAVDIDWIAGEVDVDRGEKITVTEENLKGEYYPLYYTVKDGTLFIKFCKSGTVGSLIGGCSKKVTVRLPEGMKEIKVNSVSAGVEIRYDRTLDFAAVNTVSGDCIVSVNKADKVTIDAVSAKVALTAYDVDEIVCNSVSGDNLISGNPKEVKAHTVSGNNKILAGETNLKSVRVDTISGDTEIMLDGKNDFSLEFNTVSGKLTNELADKTGGSNAPVAIKADSVSGDLRIAKRAD